MQGGGVATIGAPERLQAALTSHHPPLRPSRSGGLDARDVTVDIMSRALLLNRSTRLTLSYVCRYCSLLCSVAASFAVVCWRPCYTSLQDNAE